MQVSGRRDPYHAALAAIRQFAAAGRFVPGDPIVVTELSAEVGLSATPVREALACLAGEGLIERRRGRGYFYPALTPSEAIDLFELQFAYLHAALKLCPRGLTSLRKAVVAADPDGGVQPIFAAIVGQSGNEALTLAHTRLTDRLKGILRIERGLDEDQPGASKRMVDVIGQGDVDALVKSLELYHETRCARAHQLIIREA